MTNLKEMRELLELCGPLDPPARITEPNWELVEALRVLGRDHGYGACMRTLSELWAQEVPGGNHTCGPCAASVKVALNIAHDEGRQQGEPDTNDDDTEDFLAELAERTFSVPPDTNDDDTAKNEEPR